MRSVSNHGTKPSFETSKNKVDPSASNRVRKAGRRFDTTRLESSENVYVKDIETFALSVPVEKPTAISMRRLPYRDFTAVKVHTNAGIVGVGCVSISNPLAVSGIVQRDLRRHVLGKEPFFVRDIWQDMYHEVYRDRRGAAIRAIAAIDIALWDIIGKTLNLPLYKILGGYRRKVPCYASVGYYRSGGIAALAREASYYASKGYGAVKIRVGMLELDKDEERVKAVRKAIGSDVKLMVDANNAYDPISAVKAGRRFERYDLAWFEEPVMPDDLLGSSQVAQALDVPIASGELEHSKFGFRDIVNLRAADIIQPDATVLGGITEWLQVSGMAETWGIPLCPHWAQEVHSQLVASTPNALYVEFFHRELGIRMEDRLYLDYLEPNRGYLEIPSKPGLGVEFDEKALARYRVH